MYAYCFTELQIYFDELDYSIDEGESTADLITMQYRRTENDFTLRLTPVSIADSESMYDVVAFVDPADIVEEARATAGDKPTDLYNLYRGHNMFSYSCTYIHFLSFADDDFSSAPFEVMIPAGTTTLVLPPNFRVEDDNMNEIEQDYALIGELGDDVTDKFACFQRRDRDHRGCAAGRTGATTIRIFDNDR